MARKLRSIAIDGPAGKLEALLEEPAEAPLAACLVCHPHPLYGGTMHNKVVHRMARGLRRAGAVVLRFNFRGAGRSEGVHDHGRGELFDALAALTFLRHRYAGLPWSLAGFSFGSRIALRLACREQSRVIVAGFPTHSEIPPGLETCGVEKVFIQSTRDQYGPKQELEAVFGGLADPKRLIWVDAQDHFFTGALDELEETVRSVGLRAGGPA